MKHGGLKNIWVRAWDAAAIVDETSAGFVKLTVNNTTLALKETQQSGTGKAVDQSVVFTIVDADAASMNSLVDALLCDYFIQVIVQTKNEGRKIVLGELWGLRGTVNKEVGAKMADLHGATVELKGVNDKFGREI